MEKEIVNQVQEAQRVQYKMNTRRNMLRHANQTNKDQTERKNIKSSN